MEDNKNKTKVDLMYDDLYEQGYLEKDRDTFNKFFYAPGEQGYKNRKALYDDLHEQGYLESPTYEDFARGIGLHAVQQSQPAVQAGTGPAAGGRQDLVESLNQYNAGLQSQSAPAAGNVANAADPSSRGAGAESSWSDGKSVVRRPGNVAVPYTGIKKTDPVTGEQYRVYTGAAAANADTVPSELQGRDLLDENGNLISARQWQSKYGDKPHLAGAAGLWNGGDLEYGTVLDSHIQKAIDLGMKHGDHSRMSTDELKAKRQELTDRYANGFTETPESLQDAIDLNNIDYELTARHLGYKSSDDMMKNHRGEADFELNKGRLNQDDLDFYEKQGSHVHNLGDNPLYVYGWQKFTDLAKRNEELGQSMSVEDYINALMADPDIENKFYAWTLTRAKKNNRSWASNINEAMDDFRKAISRGENPWEYAPEEKDVMAEFYGGELDRMDAEYEKELEAWQKRYDAWSANRSGLGWSHAPLGSYAAETGDNALGMIHTAQNLSKDARSVIDEAMKTGRGFSLSGEVGASVRGFRDSALDWRTWTFGITDLEDSKNMYNVAKKWKDGGQLNKAEQMLLDQMVLKAASDAFFNDYLSTGYEAGKTTGYALEFIAEMLTGAGAATDVAVRAMGSGLKKLGKKKVVQLLERIGMKGIVDGTLKKLGRATAKIGENKVGKVISKAIDKGTKLADEVVSVSNKGIGQTLGPGIAKVGAQTFENATGQAQGKFNPNTGRMEATSDSFADGMDFIESTKKAVKSQFGENASEFLGDSLLEPGIKWVNKFYRGATDKAFKKFGMKEAREFLDSLKGNDWYRFVQDFRKQVHYNGSFGEYCEEVANNIYDAAFVGDQNFNSPDDPNSVFNFKKNFRTYVSCKYMSLAFGAANVAGYRTPKYRANQDVKYADQIAKRAFVGEDWGSISSIIRDGSDEQVEQLMVDIAQSKKYNARQRQAAINYAGAVAAQKGIEAGDVKVERSAGDQEAREAYGRGYNMENLESLSAASGEYNRLRAEMERDYGAELMERMDSEPGLVYGWVRAGAVSEEDAKKVLDYLNAKMAYEGAVDRLNDDDAAAKAAAESHIDDQVHTEDNGGDGQIHPVTLKGRDGDHYVVSGNVVTDNNGKVDVDASDNEIVVVDSNGKRMMTTAKDIAQVGDTIDPDAAKAQAVAQISSVEAGVESGEDLDSEEGRVESTEGFEDTGLEDTDTTTGTAAAQGALPVSEYNQDDLVTVEVDGQRVNGIVTNGLDDNGNVTLYLEEPINGRQNVQLTPEQLNQVAVSYTSRDGETISRGETPQEPQQPQPQQQQTPTAPVQVVSEEVSGEPSDDEAIAQGTQSQVPTSGEYSVQSEEAASPSGATQQAPAQPSLPVGEDGNADFSNATPQEAHDYIYNDPELDEDEANEVVRSYAAGAQTRLDEAQAALKQAEAVPAPKMEDYRSGNAPDVAGYKRAKRERNETIAQAQAAVDAAQREVDLWNGVQAQHMMDRATAAAANRAEERGQSVENPAAPSAPAPVSGESENNAPTPSQATPPQGQQTTESTQEPSAPQPNEGNAPVASTTPSSSEEERGESAPVNETAGAAEEELTPDERIERARMEALENRAEELAESCGLPVQVARSLDDLSDRHRREVEKQHAAGKYVNGFYDPMTKQIVLFLPDIAKNGGMRRLERTFLHEGVAHGGLRALFENAQNGIQTFDELCDQVWEMMPVVTQAQMMNYIGVQKPEDMTQEKKRIAADEYMAHLAEWGVEQSVKSRIISAVKNALRKIGVKMKLSNNDIVSLLAASRRKLNEMDKVGLNSAISEALDNDGEDEGEGVRMSTTAIFEGAGLEVSRDATDNEGKPTKEPLTDSKGNLVARIGDKEFSVDNPVKAEDLKPAKMGHAVKESSVLHMLIEDSKKYSGLSDAQADKIYQNYADLLNMYLYMGSAAMGGPETVTEAWEWLGDSVFRTIAANGDAQYSYSMDIIRVCKKNEAVIKAMSALQLREGRGATPSEIVELYRETHEDGYQVPCPVCYVFTRYIRNGKYASAAIKGMEKWGDHLPGGSDVWSVDQWVDALDKIQRETNPDYKPDGKNKMKGKELEKAKRFKKQLDQANNITVAYEKRVNALSYLLTTDDAIKAGTIKNKKLELTPERRASIEKELDIINEQYQHAVEIIAHQALSNWIKTHAIEEKDGKWTMREDAKKPEDIDDYKRNALDLRLTSNTIVNYPAIQRLRKSGGSAAGKEISFASDNRLGEVVSGLGINKTNLSGYKNKYEEALHATGRARTKARNEARKRFKDATVYALMQTLRGGQRMWSWSDNIERLSPDIAINIMQLQLLGGAMQTYSKQLEGIKLAAQMGAYVNGSLMAKDNGYQEVADKDVEERDGKLWLKHDITDEVEEYPVGGGEPKPRKRIVAAKGSYVYQAEDGKKYVLIYDDVVGVDPFGNELHGKGKKKGLFQLNQEYDRAGNILVGMNDLHVRAAMADPAVFFIIPWHSSGANNHILNQMLNILEQTMTDRLDYTAMQEEKNMLERNKDTKKLPEVNKRLRDLWEEGRQWAKQNKWKSGMEVDSNGDVITESQYMYRQLRAQIFNGNIFEAMPSEEQYRAAVDIVNNMQATMDELDARNEAWKAKSPEYKKSPEGKAEKKAIDKVKGKAKNRYNPALHTIELHDGLIDWRDSSQHEGDAEWQEQHPKRINVEEARRMIEADEFLSQVLKRVEPIGHMTNGDNTYIYPYEYWDESSTYDTADINGKRYVEYCRRMGYKPKFSGRWGEKVTEENMNDGNFVHDPGYWKLLIDRRMYDRNGKYQWLDPVTSENFEPDLVNPLKTGEEFNITQVADDKDAEDIAERVYNNMAERDGGVAKVDYSKPLEQIMDEYDAALAAGVQANVKLTDAEEDALDDMEEAMEEEDVDSGVMFSTSPTFYSNAERAAENIKQNKATAEQWKAMLTKAGGLKSGEDKWMGLSTWLDENKGKSLTKDEVLQFVRDNGIQMEEVNYGDVIDSPRFQELRKEYREVYNNVDNIFKQHNKRFADYVDEMESKYGKKYYSQMTPQEKQIYNRLSIDQELFDPNIYDESTIAIREMANRYGDDFEVAFSGYQDSLVIEDDEAASSILGDVQAINSTRLDYTTDGLSNLREIAFVVPNVESYQENDEVHFGPENQGKAIMWVRFGETTDADGNRVLVIDEIQSNRHQDAREKGYKVDEKTAFAEYKKAIVDYKEAAKRNDTEAMKDAEKRYNLYGAIAGQLPGGRESIPASVRDAVPAAPFEKNWHEVAMKRMLRLAAEEGFDKVAWTTGEQQAKRYNLGRMYDSIEREDNPSIDGKRFVLSGRNMDTFVVNKEGNIEDSSFSEFNGKPLSDVVGKDLAERMMNLEDGDMLEGEDLRIGGEGMKGFYDQMLPRFMDKYGKRWGVKTGTVELPNVEEAGRTMHSVDVTPEMKESVMQGQPLFSVTGIEAFERYPDDVYRTERVRKDLAELQLRYNLPRIHLFDETVTVEDLMAIDTTNDSEAEKRKIAEETLALVINKKMKGYYSPDTKEIAIFAQNISRPIILEQTLFHENFHGWVDHYSDKSRINILLDELYAQGENLHKELYDALNEGDGYTKEERPEEFMAYYMSEAMILGDLEEDVYKYLSKDNQRLVDIFLNDIGYERSEEEPRRHKRDQEVKRIKSSKTKTQGANNGEVAKTDREANPGESGDETRRISFSTSAAVAALKDDERVYNDLLGKVFSGVSNETRRGIVEDAMRNRGNDFGAATEAWLGGLADDGKFADVDRRDWGRVKLALHQALMDNGVDVSEPLSDGESRYVLWKAGQVDDGVFSLAEDVVMQDRLLPGEREEGRGESDVRFSTSKVEQMTPIEKRYPDMEDFKDNSSILFHYKWATRHLDENFLRLVELDLDEISKDINSQKKYIKERPWAASEASKRKLEGLIKLRDNITKELEQKGKAQGNNAWGIKRGTSFTFDQFDKLFKAHNSDPINAELWDKVLATSKALGIDNIKVVGNLGSNTSGASFGGRVRISEQYLNSYARSDNRKAETMLHEMIHHVTSYAFNAVKEKKDVPPHIADAVRTLNDVFNAIKSDPDFNGQYGKSDVYELVAELSNPEFRDKLKEKNLWQKIVDGLMRLLGYEPREGVDKTTAYAEARAALEKLLENPDTDLYKEYAEDLAKYRPRFKMESEQESDLRFSVSPRDRAIARDQYERYMRNGRLQWVESMQDSMLGLKKLMQAIMGNNWTKIEDVPMYENPYIAENLMSSVTAAQQQAFYTEFMKPLLEEVGKLCKGGKKAREKAREELTNYLMAKHGLERNQVLADRDAQETAQAGGNYQDAYAENRERDYSGLTALTGEDDVHAAEAKAQQIVDDYEAQHDTTELWSRINAATQVTLEKQYKSGMLSYAEYQRISDMFEYYVPLRGWEETTSDQVYGYLTSKAGPFLGGGIVKRAGGRSSKADDPIATIAQMGDDSIRTGNRNLMKQRFLNFVQNHPSDAVSVSDLWLQYDAVTDEWVPVFADLDPNDSPEVVEQKLQAFEQQMQQLASQEPTKYKHGREAANIPYRVIPGMEKEHQVLVKRNGQTWVLTINGNPRAAQALNGLTNPDVPMEGAWASMIKGAEWVNRTLSALYTTLSPAFIVSNFLRDTGYSNTMVWVRESPNYALRFNKNYLKLNPGTLRWLLGKWEDGTLDESKPLQKHFKEFMLNGGETGFAMVKDLDKYKKDLLNEVKNMNSRNFVRKGMKVLGSQYELLGRSIENCARFAAYMTSREMGRSAERAAYDAKEISVNFNKKGSGGKSLGKVGQTKTGNVGAFVSGMARSLYTFWNAGVQGMTNAGRAVKRHPVKAALMGVGPLYAAGFLAPILAQLMGAGGDGDDDKNAYYNLPEYVRRSNLCIWLGDAWLTIPLPIEFRSIYGLGELTYGVISGNERYSDEELLMQVAGQFSQLLPIDMLEGGGGFHPFIPTLFKPIVEAEQNKSWSGLPIYRSSEWNKDDPEYTKAFSNANEWIVSGAEWLNAMTGGDEFKKGWIDLNPAKIEYMLKGYLGGIYTTIDEVRRAAETALGERDFEWRNIPLANRVIKQGDERTESKKLRDEYFKYKEDYENTKHLINKYKNAENTDLFDYAKKLDLMNNSKEYGRYLIFEKYATMLDAYQKAKKGASGEVLKKIEEDEKVLMRQLVDEMHAFEDGKLTVGDRPKLSKKDRSEDYGYMYNRLRTYVDINEDALLDSALKRAKAADDKGLVAALNSIKRSISEMKKGLGRGKDEEVMNSIRQMRNSVLRSFGFIGGEEEAPEPEEQWTEEPQEDWGDEGNADFDEPIEPYPDDEDDEYDY